MPTITRSTNTRTGLLLPVTPAYLSRSTFVTTPQYKSTNPHGTSFDVNYSVCQHGSVSPRTQVNQPPRKSHHHPDGSALWKPDRWVTRSSGGDISDNHKRPTKLFCVDERFDPTISCRVSNILVLHYLHRHHPPRENSRLRSSFVIRSPLCRTMTHLTTSSTHPPSSSTRMPSTHLPATFNIDYDSRRQIIFLPLRERRSLVWS